MNAVVGWALAGAALLAGWLLYGWQGVVLALTMISFWMLLQFSRTLRVLRGASQSPVGHVASAVMLNARLHERMSLPQVITMTRSLGRKVRDEPETFAWRDDGGDEVEVEFKGGRSVRWSLRRAPAGDAGDRGAPGSGTGSGGGQSGGDTAAP